MGLESYRKNIQRIMKSDADHMYKFSPKEKKHMEQKYKKIYDELQKY